MSLSQEARRGMRGAWSAVRRDPGALAWFDLTRRGYWRSFYAGALLAPIYACYLVYIGPFTGADKVPAGWRWTVEAIAFVLGLFAWPLLAVYATRLLDCFERYEAYITAYNWAQLLFVPPFLLINAAAVTILGGALGGVIALAMLGAVLVAEGLIAWQMLGIPPHRAVLVQSAVILVAELEGEVKSAILQTMLRAG